jgi:CheY-like chemotaxis protein
MYCFQAQKNLIKIFVNLIDNSIKFTEKDEINFGSMILNNREEFFLKENSIGIPGEVDNEIFIRYTKTDITDTGNYIGMGIGHNISTGPIDIFTGKTLTHWEENEQIHYYFNIPYFPTGDFVSSENTSNLNIEDISKSLRILIAEDDDINYMFIEYLFNNSKHKLVRAINGQEAVDIINKDTNFDIILMDLKMPIMSGFEATKIIKSIAPDIPIIALTAYVFEDDKQKAMNSGCDDFIVKPYRMEDLFNKIIRLVG